MQDSAGPGWYHAEGDPPNTERYWDGNAWTEGPRPVGGFPSAPPQPTGPAAVAAGYYTESSQAQTALILSIVGFFCCITAPFGTYMGWKEKQAIDEGRRDPSSRGMAIAALIIGGFTIAISVLGILFILVAGIAAG